MANQLSMVRIHDILTLYAGGLCQQEIAQKLGVHRQTVARYLRLSRTAKSTEAPSGSDETFAGQDRILTKYLKPDLLIIDDMGIKHLPKQSGEYRFEIILRRHQLRSTIMTSNRPIEDWGKLIGDVPAATAILDRFLQQAEIIAISGKSYRLKKQACKKENE